MPIRVLPDEVATRIAAGEIVERPASVIKELMENAIDAGAQEMRLEILDGGHRKMRVLDDGYGIPSNEVELAFARHSTSKLTSVDDLEHIHTLGFRGEALASIAAVARVTVVTRVADEEVGRLLRLDGGEVTAREPAGRPPGTAVTVEDLFFNVPARRKFLRTERTERRQIDILVTRYAMAYPHLRFILTHNGRTTFQSNGSGNLREVLVSIYGAANASQMVEVGPGVGSEVPGQSFISVQGYTSAPSLHRSNRNEITLFVNGRWVHDQRLTFAVVQAYHTLLMSKRYPLAVLDVRLPPEDVDVNVHPAKTQVRFRDGDAVFRAVQRAVRRALMDYKSLPQMGRIASEDGFSAPQEPGEQEWPGGWPTPAQLARRARLRALGGQRQDTQFQFELAPPARVQAGPPGIVDRAFGVGEQGDEPATTRGRGKPGSTLVARTEQSLLHTPRRPDGLPVLRVVGQLGLTYVVAEGPEGMFLVDQHAAHERVLYEKLTADANRAHVASQLLLEPRIIELTLEGFSLVEESLDALLKLGFDLEPFGTSTVLVRAVPTLLINQELQTVFEEVVADLQEGEDPLNKSVETRIVRQICKQAAIKGGQALSQQEMDELLRQLEACAAPRTCPHGRPTMIHLSATQLAREFGRLG